MREFIRSTTLVEWVVIAAIVLIVVGRIVFWSGWWQ